MLEQLAKISALHEYLVAALYFKQYDHDGDIVQQGGLESTQSGSIEEI